MSRGTNQKLKLYYLSRIMLEKTDDGHALTIQNIKDELWQYGVTADRKSLYTDLQDLELFGLEIIKTKSGWDTLYHVGSKPFEVAEIKVLIDLIQSARSLSEHVSANLIRKLERFISQYEASALNRHVRLWNRGKTSNESVLYHVDEIHRAICDNKKLRVFYLSHSTADDTKAIPDFIIDVSPWMLTCHGEQYLLIGYEEGKGGLCRYRLDRMRNCDLIDGQREGEEAFKDWLQRGMYADLLPEGENKQPDYEKTIKNTRSD